MTLRCSWYKIRKSGECNLSNSVNVKVNKQNEISCFKIGFTLKLNFSLFRSKGLISEILLVLLNYIFLYFYWKKLKIVIIIRIWVRNHKIQSFSLPFLRFNILASFNTIFSLSLSLSPYLALSLTLSFFPENTTYVANCERKTQLTMQPVRFNTSAQLNLS